jgi:hypothetical protein
MAPLHGKRRRCAWRLVGGEARRRPPAFVPIDGGSEVRSMAAGGRPRPLLFSRSGGRRRGGGGARQSREAELEWRRIGGLLPLHPLHCPIDGGSAGSMPDRPGGGAVRLHLHRTCSSTSSSPSCCRPLWSSGGRRPSSVFSWPQPPALLCFNVAGSAAPSSFLLFSLLCNGARQQPLDAVGPKEGHSARSVPRSIWRTRRANGTSRRYSSTPVRRLRALLRTGARRAAPGGVPSATSLRFLAHLTDGTGASTNQFGHQLVVSDEMETHRSSDENPAPVLGP